MAINLTCFLYSEGIDETVKQVKSVGGRCNGYVVDISKKEEVYKAAELIRNEIGNVSKIIINNFRNCR